jgi:hypothetical protein
VDDKEIEVRVFPETNFGGNPVSEKWEADGANVPSVNTQAMKWTSAEATPTVYWLAYQPDNEYAATKVTTIEWKKDQDPYKGSLDLQTADNFPVDTTAITYLTIIDNILWASYKSAAGTGVASCTLNIKNSDIVIDETAGCTEYTVPAPQNAADSIVLVKEGDDVFAYLYYKDATTNYPTISYCTVNVTAGSEALENCVASNQFVELYGAEFDKLSYVTDAGPSVSFSILDDGETVRRNTLTLFNV